jgi:hypothetical protein
MLDEIEKKISQHKARKKALTEERARLVQNYKNENALKLGRALDVAKKSEDKSDGEYVDSVLQAKMQSVESLKANIEKLDLAIASQDALIREANSSRKAMLQADEMDQRTESAKEIFAQLDAVIEFQKKAQTAFVLLKDSILAHPSAAEGWVGMAQKLGRHAVYGITLDSILTLGNLAWLTFDKFIEQLHELVRPGIGSYQNVPETIKPFFDGSIQSPVPIDRAFEDRSNPSGLTILHSSDQAAKDKLQEIWRR